MAERLFPVPSTPHHHDSEQPELAGDYRQWVDIRGWSDDLVSDLYDVT
jgi:hypothetical protein